VCNFITLIFPPGVRTDEIEVVGQKHRGRKFKLTPDNTLCSWLSAGETQFLTRNAGCDCDTSLGSRCKDKADVASEHESWRKEARKLQAKGWSAHKVERWLDEKRGEQERRRRQETEDEAHLDLWAHENDDWFGLLGELLDTGQTHYVGLLLRWGRDKIKNRVRVNLRDQGLMFLLEIEENVIYEFY
jgi:hypothetical protein